MMWSHWWRGLEIWQFFEPNIMTLFGCLSILTLFFMALWSAKIDNRQIDSIRYRPSNKKHYGLHSMSMRSNFSHQTTEGGCTDNTPIYPSSFVSKTPPHAPDSSTEEKDKSTKRELNQC